MYLFGSRDVEYVFDMFQFCIVSNVLVCLYIRMDLLSPFPYITSIENDNVFGIGD